MKIVTSKSRLSIPCDAVSLKTAKMIGDKLTKILVDNQDYWMGLAANQIGYNARVMALFLSSDDNQKPTLFVNPHIVSTYGEIEYVEYCVSFPNKVARTRRYQQINIEDDINGKTSFYAPKPIGDSNERHKSTLECVGVQHEIDHLDGITMFDRRIIDEQIKSDKVGRNAPCPCGSGIKFKKCCLSG